MERRLIEILEMYLERGMKPPLAPCCVTLNGSVTVRRLGPTKASEALAEYLGPDLVTIQTDGLRYY